MSDSLPESVFFRPTQVPSPFFRLVTFNFENGISAEQAKSAISDLWVTLEELQKGIIKDLDCIRRNGEPVIRVEAANLFFKIGFGGRLWNVAYHTPSIAMFRPYELPRLEKEGPFAKLRWATGAARDSAQTDFMFVIHADTELAVARAVVELQKSIDDGPLPLKLICFFSGLHRDDGRSWIDFHDGLNNLRSGLERQSAVEIVQGERSWAIGGTKMAFMKIAVALQGWRKLSREQQEVIVGRDKLTGCPVIDSMSNDGKLSVVLDSDCPSDRPIDPELQSDEPLVSASAPANGLAQLSHIHRANRSQLLPDQDAASRIFRQGYEFVDSPEDGGVRVGLNFVSFQRMFASLATILGTPNWMGDVNFGGQAGGTETLPDFELMSMVAGGYFIIPPIRDMPFPGASVF